MNKLLKTYNLFHATDYYQLCLDSFINGQRKQAADLFLQVPQNQQKEMIKWLRHEEDDRTFNFFIDLL